jgi:regulator of sigma E protease
MGVSVISFVIVLGVLILVHEFGHFIVARLCGVGVQKFSIGFGPRLFGKTVGITDYRISAIPLGGYVKMVGDEVGAELEPEELPYSFIHKSLWKRTLIVAAGPLANFALAVVIFFFLFLFLGSNILKPTVGEVGEDSPAKAAGIRAGDTIAAINGTPIESWEEMAALIGASKGRSVDIAIEREGEIIDFQITPKTMLDKNIFGEEVERYIIGISSSGEVTRKEMGLFQSLGASLEQTYNISHLTVMSVAKIIQGTLSTKTLGGPIMIAEMAGEQAKAGAGNLLFFMALLSINLAILNFLPIPVLDGGHLLFFLIEAIIRRPVSIKVREFAQQTGVVLLVMLMVFVFYNDITRLLFN